MPEGDTIWRTARTLEAALAGKTVTAFASSLVAVEAAAARHGVVGKRIERVEAHGKHLLVCFEGGLALHTHLGMKGGWRIEGRGGARRRPPSSPRARLEAGDTVAVCVRAPVVEMLSARQRARHPALVRLGPDLLARDFDPEAARARLRGRRDEEIAVALLDQTALAGLGNVYKSEVLFLEGVSPFARVHDLDDLTLAALVSTSRRLMSRNLGGGPRRTTSSLSAAPLWVYRRAGKPCRRCGSAIRRALQGDEARSTWYCPSCQGVPSGRAPRR